MSNFEIKDAKNKPFERRRHEPTNRTAQRYPISEDPPTFNPNEAESNYNGRFLTWDITGKSTHHLQENIQIIADFINEKFLSSRGEEIIGNSVHHGNFSLWTKSRKLTCNLKNGKIDKTELFRKIEEL